MFPKQKVACDLWVIVESLCFLAFGKVAQRCSDDAHVINSAVVPEVGIFRGNEGILDMGWNLGNLANVSSLFPRFFRIWDGVDFTNDLAMTIFNDRDGRWAIGPIVDAFDVPSKPPEDAHNADNAQ